ncbi:TetR/AcrR family transcriptional regulator [Streptomyces sp. NPDC090994]|uniref:TetR/AcrR family transcriptional regulator n=1 Tax=Streptomyces sp. NPDC090994 TaxID=3365969 RepID=UPI0038298719
MSSQTRSNVPGEVRAIRPHAEGTLRADAERNRRRIIATARRLFAREGLGVSLTSVAREAGVGNATLFRRFASREDLIDAVFTDRVDAHRAAVAAALDETDPWQGFAGYVQSLCALQAADPGFIEILTLAFPAGDLERRRAEAADGALRIISRAQESGHLRTDFHDLDLSLLLMANDGVADATLPEASRRLVAHLLRAWATPGTPVPPLPEAPPRTALHHAMVRLIRTRPVPQSTPGTPCDFALGRLSVPYSSSRPRGVP